VAFGLHADISDAVAMWCMGFGTELVDTYNTRHQRTASMLRECLPRRPQVRSEARP
jgi:hypothetical protein